MALWHKRATLCAVMAGLSVVVPLHAQQGTAPRRGLPVISDSVRMLPGAPLTFDAFFDLVRRNHPVVRQAASDRGRRRKAM